MVIVLKTLHSYHWVH